MNKTIIEIPFEGKLVKIMTNDGKNIMLLFSDPEKEETIKKDKFLMEMIRNKFIELKEKEKEMWEKTHKKNESIFKQIYKLK